MTVQAGLCRTWLELKLVFSCTGSCIIGRKQEILALSRLEQEGWGSKTAIFEAILDVMNLDVLIFGKSPIKWKQHCNMTIAVDWDVKHQFKQTDKNCYHGVLTISKTLLYMSRVMKKKPDFLPVRKQRRKSAVQ